MPVYHNTLGVAVILLAGLLGGKLAQRFKAPMVVGFIITGLLLSPSVLNIIPEQLNDDLELIKIFGLGMIALTIGGELEFKRIRDIVRSIFAITILQIIITSTAVFALMYYVFGLPLPVSLILGAMATASAPASPMANVKEYQAKGTFTSTLLGVVALLDAACLIFFAVVMAVAGSMLQGNSFQLSYIMEPFWEIIGSLFLGAISGIVLLFFARFFERKTNTLVLMLGFVLLNSGAAQILHLSPLLVNMTTGVVVGNIHPRPGSILHSFDDIELPVYIAFFLLAGASLRLDILIENWLITTSYIIVRGVGKVGGAYIGARLAGANSIIQKYLGFSMLSKAGLTIGLLIIVQKTYPQIALIITAIELAAVAVCSLVGPVGERFALISSGETKQNP